jgi:hypothetical protein
MNLNEVVKSISNISQKLTPKDDKKNGFITFSKKSNKTSIGFSNEKISCSVAIDVNNDFPDNSNFILDGKLFAKVISKYDLNKISISSHKDVDGNISSFTIKGDHAASVSMHVLSSDKQIRVKKVSSHSYNLDRDKFLTALKTTIGAGSDVDADRPYYYALVNFDDQELSVTCGNGSFFSFVKCKASDNKNPKDYFIIPIPIANALISMLDICEDEFVGVSFDDNAISVLGVSVKFSASVYRKCISWPDASSILNRKTGSFINLKKDKLKEVASGIELASDGYEQKNETLKCKVNIVSDKISFLVEGSCKVESHVEISCDIDEEKSMLIDAACIPISLKSKVLHDNIVINIDDSTFKGRPSPIVISSDINDFSYKTFFAVS